MKAILLISSLLFAFNALAGELSDDMVQKALANPKRYHFDDGGNIDFGNGFFKRRINFAGQAQVCHENNYIYGGEGKKCIKYKNKKKCKEYNTFTLMTKMVGTKTICINEPGDGDENTSNPGGNPGNGNPGNGNPGGDSDPDADSDDGFAADFDSFDRFQCNQTTVVTFKRGPDVKVKVFKKSKMNDHNENAGYLGYTYITIPPCNF